MDRILRASIEAFERCVREVVEDQFDGLRTLPDGIHKIEIPHIGGFYNPHGPHDRVVDRVVKAMTAQHFAKGPHHLPLRYKDIKKMQRSADPSQVAWGYYAERLRNSVWDIQRQPTFQEFCAVLGQAGTGF
jgi:hypothetical protein